jgi:hypothetical protein
VKHFLYLSSVIAVLAAVSLAQEERKIAFRTLCLERVGGIENVVIPVTGGGKSADIPLYTDVSPVVQGVFNTNEAAFYIEKVGPDGKANA